MTSSETISSADQLCTVFLDRDGVVNEKMPEGQFIRSWEDFHLLPGVPEAIAQLNRAGLRVIVVSNQRGVALALYTVDDLMRIHAEVQKALADHGAHIDAFYFCPHDKQACNCRKPLPGMFEQARAEYPDITVATSVMIGDSLADIEFGARLGMQTILLEGNPERQAPGIENARALADWLFASLPEAVNALLHSQTQT